MLIWPKGEECYKNKKLLGILKLKNQNWFKKKGSHCICLSVELIYSVFKMGKNCYPQVFLGECKYIFKK